VPEDSYAHLTPSFVLDALDSVGLAGDGRLLQLNSYENRVFQVFLEDSRVVVAKFYRPGRWSDAQILEEHAFALELADAEVPVVPPLVLDGRTLMRLDHEGVMYRFAVSERHAGRAPELDDTQVLRWLGRFIGRLHAVGATKRFEHRRRLDIQTFGRAPRALLLERGTVTDAELPAWRAVCDAALDAVQAAFDRVGAVRSLRLHGDCHPGNVLWREEDWGPQSPAAPAPEGRSRSWGGPAIGWGPHFVDLDDACTGPAVQDLWMLVSGNADAMAAQMRDLLAGYRAFMPFDDAELGLIEALRTLRMIHHSAWIAERWSDPAFPAAFPWFGTPAYWSQQTTQLREQLAAMEAPSV
jgi:Ser/Thr protein kinase RdoA (MazF antagonist)